ncbi:hypothetical protein DSO57_1023305 [Entomophthora muscae]|uniref:Uncharacterized protein n=1 Tax=Entomophthora muscae TaxID=34485 RepID=A0ACC2SRW1_9FUNG|nr:hypothetical protein DSO57_1023305 [Entomophthora muscae]
MISLVCFFLLHGSIHLVSACGGSIPEKRRRAVPQFTGLAAQRNPGSGFNPCSQAWVSREEELSILTASVEDLDRVLLGIDKAQLAFDRKKVPPGYNSVDHVIQDALVLAGIYGFVAPPEKLLLHSHLILLPFTSGGSISIRVYPPFTVW